MLIWIMCFLSVRGALVIDAPRPRAKPRIYAIDKHAENPVRQHLMSRAGRKRREINMPR